MGREKRSSTEIERAGRGGESIEGRWFNRRNGEIRELLRSSRGVERSGRRKHGGAEIQEEEGVEGEKGVLV